MFELHLVVQTTAPGGVGPSRRRRLRRVLGLVSLLVACGLAGVARAQDGDTEVEIPDEGLRCAIVAALGKTADEAVTQDDMTTLTELSSSCDPLIGDLTGLEYASALEVLKLPGNAVSDLEPLSELSALVLLDLAENVIVEIEPLSGLTALATLNVAGNRIADVAPLADLTNLSTLRLENNSIASVASLSELTALNTLDLANNRIADIAPLAMLTRLGTLGLDGNGISDITSLSGMTALQTLNLAGNQVADVAPLAALADLYWLRLDNNSIASVASLSDLTGLGVLGLGQNRIADVAPLTGLTDLTWLRLDGNAIADIAPLSGMTGLDLLNLADNRIADVAPVAGLTDLTWLNLRRNAISDIAPLSDLTALGVLNLSDNRISDIGPLARLTELTWLNLNDNAIPDLAPLSDLVGLESLYLRANAVSALEPLEGLTNVAWLTLSGNAVTDIGPLASLTNVVSLALSDNAIVDIGSLASLTSVAALSLPGNEIVDLEPLASLTALRAVDLGDNAVADVQPLSGLDLETLTLYGNAITDIGPLADLATIRRLDLRANAITDVAPLAGLATLADLYLGRNSIEDVQPLSRLTGLRLLVLSDNSIKDIEPLSSLTALWFLLLDENPIEGIEPLSGLAALVVLGLAGNSIGDLEPLEGLTRLTWLNLADTAIKDIGPLESLTGLGTLSLYGNAIEDAGPLVGLPGLQTVDMRRNPLQPASISDHLQRLRVAGATARRNWEHAGREVVWFVPSAGDPARQGFVRVINDSDAGVDASITAIDRTGRRYGPLTLTVGAHEAVHINSDDLEAGNPGKGLPEGTGPGDGDWRLEVVSDLELTVLGYMRTQDGFVTSMHDVVPVAGNGYRIVTFNPSSNLAQASSLRLTNPGTRDAEVRITGVDDAGASPGSAVNVDVAAGATVTLAASDLESGTVLDKGLGDGSGKWRLRLEPTQPIVAMSLLSNPTGHLTNLSTTAARVGDAYRVPLFPSATDVFGRQGFVRVRNRSAEAGLVRIEAYDDSDRFHKAIVYLRIGGGETRHFNSEDLEWGNEVKGLVGNAEWTQGDWVLRVSSGLDIEVMSYIRTADGFLTSMHDVTPRFAGVWRVAIFNPGSNRDQVSSLRLYNHESTAADVRISAMDDSGWASTAIRVTVPARASRTISAGELENGSAALDGAFGDGHGKWRLRVESDADLSVMHLLSSPTGHLTNLSTAPY